MSWLTCAWLAQSVEHETLNLRVVGSSPTSGGCNYHLMIRCPGSGDTSYIKRLEMSHTERISRFGTIVLSGRGGAVATAFVSDHQS